MLNIAQMPCAGPPGAVLYRGRLGQAGGSVMREAIRAGRRSGDQPRVGLTPPTVPLFPISSPAWASLEFSQNIGSMQKGAQNDSNLDLLTPKDLIDLALSAFGMEYRSHAFRLLSEAVSKLSKNQNGIL